MKKIIILIMAIFLLTGCGKVSTEKSVYKYLKKKYPNESFTVELYRDVTIESPTGGCELVPGHTWNVTSKETGITFYVQDDYIFNSFVCKYSLTDDYFAIYLSNKIKGLYDYRFVPDNEVHVNDIDDVTGYGFLDSIHSINLDLKDFSSKQELATRAVDVQKILMEDERIEDGLPYYFWYFIYDHGEFVYKIDFRSADNVDYILEKMDSNK